MRSNGIEGLRIGIELQVRWMRRCEYKSDHGKKFMKSVCIVLKVERGLPSQEKAQGLRPCPVGVRGFKSLPPHVIRRQMSDFLEKLYLKDICNQEIKAYERDISEFLEVCCYQINVKSIIIYINELKRMYKPKTVRNKITRVRSFLTFLVFLITCFPSSSKATKNGFSSSTTKQILPLSSSPTLFALSVPPEAVNCISNLDIEVYRVSDFTPISWSPYFVWRLNYDYVFLIFDSLNGRGQSGLISSPNSVCSLITLALLSITLSPPTLILS